MKELNVRDYTIICVAFYLLGVFTVISTNVFYNSSRIMRILFPWVIFFTFLVIKFLSKKFHKFKVVFRIFSISSFCFLVGLWRAYYVDSIKKNDFLNFENKSVWITGVVKEDPVVTKSKTKLETVVTTAKIRFNGREYSSKNNIIIYGDLSHKDFKKVEYKDKITCFVKLVKPNEAAFPGAFDFKKYLKQKSVYMIGFCDEIQKSENVPSKYFISNFGVKLRKKILEFENKIDGDDEKALWRGILLGDQNKITPIFREKISKSGMSHIISFSGIKISIFLSIISILIGNLKIKRKLLHALFIIFLLIIGVACRSTPSVMNSIIINTIFLSSIFFDKQSDSINSILLSVGILTFYNPFVIQNVGLILSVTSSLSIRCFGNKLKHKFNFLKKIPKIGIILRDAIAINISLFIGTSYFIAKTFNVFSIWMLVNNIFITFIISYVFGISLILIFINHFLGAFSKSLCLLNFPLKWIVEFINRLSEVKCYWQVPSPNKFVAILYLIGLTALYYYLNQEKISEKIEKDEKNGKKSLAFSQQN